MSTIIRAAAALAAAAAFAPAAQAADAAMPAAYDWSGFYAGVNAGVAWNNSTVDNQYTLNDMPISSLAHNLDDNQAAFTGGGLLGYNYQIDRAVIGVEADINYLGFSSETDYERSHVDPMGATWESTNKLSFEGNWFGTLRGRLGYAMDNVLLYGTGGAAYGHMKVRHDYAGSSDDGRGATVDGSVDTVNWGWTIGAGVEYGIDRWSLGLEYLFVDLGSANWDSDVSFLDESPRDFDAEGKVDWRFSTVRATAKLRF